MADLKKYRIESMTTKVGSRLQRYQSPTRHPENIFVAGRRLLADRSIEFTIEEFEKNSKEIEAKVRAGLIRMIAPDGTIIDSVYGGRLTTQSPGQPIRVENAKAPLERPHVAGIDYPLPPENGPTEVPEQISAPAEPPEAPAEPVEEEPAVEEAVEEEPAAEASTTTRRKKR